MSVTLTRADVDLIVEIVQGVAGLGEVRRQSGPTFNLDARIRDFIDEHIAWQLASEPVPAAPVSPEDALAETIRQSEALAAARETKTP